MRFLFMLCFAVAFSCWSGCSGPSAKESGNASVAATKSGGASDATEERYQKPVETVKQFLIALKAGDTSKVRAMLTRKAQDETTKHDLKIQPPGSATANFTVDSNFKYAPGTKQIATVQSRWIDQDESGNPAEYEIAWIVRYEDGGWAIAGFATELFPDEELLVLSFEDPVEMMRKRKWADQELARRGQERLRRQASVPAGTRR